MNTVITGEIMFDAIAVLAAGVICLYVHRRYYIDSKMMELRFKAFALRDKLSMLAVKGVLSEEAQSYLFLQEKINVLIQGCEQISIRTLVRAINQTRSEESSDAYAKLSREIKKQAEVVEIYVETLECLLAAFYLNSLIMRLFLFSSSVFNFRQGNEVKKSIECVHARIHSSRQDWPGLVTV